LHLVIISDMLSRAVLKNRISPRTVREIRSFAVSASRLELYFESKALLEEWNCELLKYTKRL
jgi:hypothetical protein